MICRYLLMSYAATAKRTVQNRQTLVRLINTARIVVAIFVAGLLASIVGLF